MLRTQRSEWVTSPELGNTRLCAADPNTTLPALPKTRRGQGQETKAGRCALDRGQSQASEMCESERVPG